MRIVLSLIVLLSFSFAQESSASSQEQSALLALMAYIKDKPTLSAKDINEKKEGNYFTGLPLLNFDPDKGTGFGARLYWYDNQDKSNLLFNYTPYRQQIFAQYFQTSKGWQYHWLYWDLPYIADTRFRLTTSIAYEKNTQAHFFGLDSSTLNPLTAPGGTTYTSMDAYQNALNDVASPYYDRYLFEKPFAEITLQYDIAGGLVRIASGLYLSKATIQDYANKTVSLNGAETFNTLSRLNSTIVGYKGGIENAFKLGIIYDSRDFVPNPKSGSAHDFMMKFFTPLLGSEYEYQQYTLSTKNFYTPSWANRVTLAAEAVYVAQFGTIPFYSLSAIGFSDETKQGLGGLRTLRGYAQDRFMGPVKAYANIEARWQMFSLGSSQRFDFILVPFIDTGSVFDSVEQTTLLNWKSTQGVGLRVAWNQATIIMFDYGVSSEESGLYINFNHIF